MATGRGSALWALLAGVLLRALLGGPLEKTRGERTKVTIRLKTPHFYIKNWKRW